MIDAIVYIAAGILAAFTLVWLLRPDLRAWIEHPKYRFLAQTRRYDESREEK